MTSLLAGSRFARAIRSSNPPLSDRQLRRLVFDYCQRYQEVYWFDWLENAFAYLELAFTDGAHGLVSELDVVKSEVEEAMGEYCESLNEAASALYPLLFDAPLAVADALQAIEHVWHAYACNEPPSEYADREDAVLCELLESLTTRSN